MKYKKARKRVATKALRKHCGRSYAATTMEKQIEPSNIIDVPAKRTPPPIVTIDDFEILSCLGEGGYGKVLQVRKRIGNDKGTIYALKVLDKPTIETVNRVATLSKFRTERDILEKVNHPFVCDMKYAMASETKQYFVLEYLGGGDLFERLISVKSYDEPTAKFYLCEVLLGVEYLHSIGVIYRDLKLENILLDNDGHVKLLDFGLSKSIVRLGQTTKTVCGTPEYMAPEVLNGEPYGQEVDWWAFGICIYILLTGNTPFAADDDKQTYEKILSGVIHWPKTLTLEAKDIMQELLHVNPSKRVTREDGASYIKTHPFFAHCDWELVLSKDTEPPFKPMLKSGDDRSNFPNQVPLDGF